MDEKKEKKTFKEKVVETKDKAKTFIVEHKSDLIKIAIGTAVTVGGIVLFKKAASSIDEEFSDVTKLDIVKDLPSSDAKCDDEELCELIKQEVGWEQAEHDIMEKFKEVDQICKDHGISYDVGTTFGTDEGVDSSDHYLGSMAFKDGTCFHDTM